MVSRSEIFRTPASPYAKIEIRRNAWKAGLPALIVLMVLTVLAFSDIRFIVVALILVCVLYPMLLLLAWLKLTASPAMTLRMRPQRLTRHDDGTITIHFYSFNEENPEQVESHTLTADDIESIEHIGNYYVINLEQGFSPRFYLIPSQIITDNPTLLNNL